MIPRLSGTRFSYLGWICGALPVIPARCLARAIRRFTRMSSGDVSDNGFVARFASLAAMTKGTPSIISLASMSWRCGTVSGSGGGRIDGGRFLRPG